MTDLIRSKKAATLPTHDSRLQDLHADGLGNVWLSRLFAMASWMTCSVCLILFNKLVLHKYAFAFPLSLTFVHMLANACVLVCVFEAWHVFPSPYRGESCAFLMQAMAPVAVLFAASTFLRNSAYLYLPVSTIQLLCSVSPVLFYLASCGCGLEQPRPARGLAVLAITGGCTWALCDATIRTPAHFWGGVWCQLSGLVLEAARGSLLKKVMIEVGQQTPIALLYIVSPMVCGLLVVPILLTESERVWVYMWHQDAQFFTLLGVNIVLAVGLNWSSVFFLKSFDVTTTSVAALVKDSALILGTMVVHNTAAGGRFYVGYGVTAVGVMAYALVAPSPASSKQQCDSGQKCVAVQGRQPWRLFF